MDEFQDLPIQFGQVLKAKNFNRCVILLVGLGGPTLTNKQINETRGSSLVMEWQNYPEFFLGIKEASSNARLKRGKRKK